jgi:hypothetical protein
MVVDACNLRTWEAKAGDRVLEANLGYILRHCLKNKQKQPGMVTHICNPTTWEMKGEASESIG